MAFENNQIIHRFKNRAQWVKDVLSRKDNNLHTLNILDIASKRDILWESRAISHTMSGLSIGASAAGVGTAGAAMAGVAVVPVIGWIVAGVTIGTLAAKIAVEQTVLK